MPAQTLEYRGHTVRAMEVKGVATARIFVGMTALVDLKADSVVAAVDDARAWIDARHATRTAARRKPYVGTADEYADFFRKHRPYPKVLAMLRAHANARTMTATQLATSVDWDSYSSANLHYGYLAHEVADELALRDLPTNRSGETFWIYALAEVDEAPTGDLTWTMHDEVFEGLRSAGLLG